MNTTEKFVDRVRRFASVHDLFVKGGKYIIALSGGADSVALLMVMKELCSSMGGRVEAAHCNFRLRGEESDRDELFCVNLCARMGVELHLAHFSTRDYAQLHRVSIEMAARELRYRYFEQLRSDILADGVCVAHHRDDSVETVLLNLVRGTGIRGLRGIQPRNGSILRPLLTVSRHEIEEFLDSLGESYVTDSTNLVADVKRNKIRLEVLPLLQTLNPNVAQSIFDTSMRVGEAIKVYDEAVEASVNELTDGENMTDSPVKVSVDRLMHQPSAESVLFYLLGSRNFTSSQVHQVYESLLQDTETDSSCQSRLYSSPTHEVCLDRGFLLLQPLNFGVNSKVMCIPEPGVYVYGEGCRLKVESSMRDESFLPSRDNRCATLDASKVKFPLVLRLMEKGDRFVPFGMHHSKLLSDFLTDLKRSVFDKRRQLVVIDASGRVLWVVGERTDNRFRVDGNTAKILTLTMMS